MLWKPMRAQSTCYSQCLTKPVKIAAWPQLQQHAVKYRHFAVTVLANASLHRWAHLQPSKRSTAASWVLAVEQTPKQLCSCWRLLDLWYELVLTTTFAPMLVEVHSQFLESSSKGTKVCPSEDCPPGPCSNARGRNQEEDKLPFFCFEGRGQFDLPAVV